MNELYASDDYLLVVVTVLISGAILVAGLLRCGRGRLRLLAALLAAVFAFGIYMVTTFQIFQGVSFNADSLQDRLGPFLLVIVFLGFAIEDRWQAFAQLAYAAGFGIEIGIVVLNLDNLILLPFLFDT